MSPPFVRATKHWPSSVHRWRRIASDGCSMFKTTSVLRKISYLSCIRNTYKHKHNRSSSHNNNHRQTSDRNPNPMVAAEARLGVRKLVVRTARGDDVPASFASCAAFSPSYFFLILLSFVLLVFSSLFINRYMIFLLRFYGSVCSSPRYICRNTRRAKPFLIPLNPPPHVRIIALPTVSIITSTLILPYSSNFLLALRHGIEDTVSSIPPIHACTPSVSQCPFFPVLPFRFYRLESSVRSFVVPIEAVLQRHSTLCL